MKKTVLLLSIIALLPACSNQSSEYSDITDIGKVVEEVVTDMDWYTSSGTSCEPSDGPRKLVELAQSIGMEYEATVTESVGDIATIVTFNLPTEGRGNVFIRGKARCEATIRQFEQSKKDELDKYN